MFVFLNYKTNIVVENKIGQQKTADFQYIKINALES